MAFRKVFIIPFVLGVVVFILGFLAGYWILPNVIENAIISNSVLDEGTEQWDRFVEIPFPINFTVYFFTIENPDEVLEGAKPEVQEKGPYVWSETRKKIIKKTEKTLIHYDELWDFKFNEKASNGHEDDTIKVVNAPLLAIIQNLEDIPFAFPTELEEILGQIFYKPDIFIEVKVKEYAFDGIRMCEPERTTDAYSMLICLTIMLMNLKLIQYNEDTSMAFYLFGYKKLPDGPFTLNRGTEEIDQLGLITRYKNSEYTNYWNGEKTACDRVHGYYTTYPPFMEDKESWQVYSTDICKGGVIYYKEKTEYKGIEGHRFTTNRDSFLSNNDNCVCINGTKDLNGTSHCYKEGLLDLNTCLGTPVVLSFPHLMWSDKIIQDSVAGMDGSSNEDHNTFLDFQPDLGIPLRGAIRIQFNIVLRPVKYAGNEIVNSTKKLPKAMFPIIWLEDKFQLSDDLVDMIQTELIDMVNLVGWLKWVIVGLGAIVVLITVVLCIWCKPKTKKV